VIATVRSNAATKSAQWHDGQALRENMLAVVDEDSLHADAKDHQSWNRNPHPDQTKIVKN
jgi:hypothetical protein